MFSYKYRYLGLLFIIMALVTFESPNAVLAEICLADVNNDGVVDGQDLQTMADEFGTPDCTIGESPILWEAKLTAFMEADPPPSEPLRIVDRDGSLLMAVETIGRGRLVDQPAQDPEFTNIRDEPNEEMDPPERDLSDIRFGNQSLRVLNSGTGYEFRLILAGKFSQDIYDTHAKEGLDSARTTDDEPVDRDPTASDEPSAEGWSNDIDSRGIRTPTTAWPWRTISNFGGCTGTLIGPRHVITAAHCINKKGTNQWYTFTVTPGMNGVGTAPYGSSTISASPKPGDPFRWYFTPEPWRDCSAGENCGQWDWGMIIIPDRLGDKTGWMGYVARPASQLNTVAHWNRGYPICPAACGASNIDNSPTGCQTARLYGQPFSGSLGSYFNTGPDGWNRNISTNCDMSQGHSGSALYHYFFDSKLNKTVPVVAMVAIQETCCICSANTNFPNINRRITPGDLGIISFFRQWKP